MLVFDSLTFMHVAKWDGNHGTVTKRRLAMLTHDALPLSRMYVHSMLVPARRLMRSVLQHSSSACKLLVTETGLTFVLSIPIIRREDQCIHAFVHHYNCGTINVQMNHPTRADSDIRAQVKSFQRRVCIHGWVFTLFDPVELLRDKYQ